MALNALRGGSSDLPRISVAHAAWNDQLYVPNKAHILTDWLLTRLLKERQNTITENPVLDPQYWLLLADILDSQSPSKKHWLLPLLNRVPVAPIFTTLLQLSASVDDHVLFAAAHRCFLRLWPLAVPKISVEALLETYGAFLRVTCCDHDLQQIGLTVIAALQYSVGNASNRKKIFTLFIQHHLPDWISLVNEPTSSEALQRAYTVGVDVLFNVESLRQPYDEQHPLVVALHDLPPDVVHPLLPRLFSAFVACTRKHRNTLFGQGSTNSSPAITHNIRSAAFTFFHSCQSLLASQKTSCVWLVRCRLLEVIRDEHLFDSGNHDAQMSLQSILPLVVLVLTGEYNGKYDVSSAMSCLSRLMEVDHDLILKDVPRILAALVPFSEPLAAIDEFLEILLNYHVKTRTIQTHLETLFCSLAARPSAPPSADIVHQYHVCASGALLQASHLARLSNAIETFLTPSQLVPTAEFILGNLRASWDLIASAKEVDSRFVLTFSLGVRLASTAFTSLPIRSLSQTDAQTAQDVFGRIRDDFLAPALSKSLKTSKKQSGGQAEPQLISCALAHMAYSMDIHHTPKLWEKAQALLEDRVVISDLSIALFRLLLKWAHQADIKSAEVLFDHILTRLGQDETNLLFMLVERWLPTLDALASRQQLRRFITSLLDIQLDGLNETSLLLSALSSADFWELGNIRAAVLSLVEERSEMAASLAIYRLLRLFPVEYLSRSVRKRPSETGYGC
ncbi:Urb2 domain-containing protein [Mycena kentingensis (nom. inval.)]|nr:Urb2 domain-containing protein [Mycena kentingensis (nom. inval.)]